MPKTTNITIKIKDGKSICQGLVKMKHNYQRCEIFLLTSNKKKGKVRLKNYEHSSNWLKNSITNEEHY